MSLSPRSIFALAAAIVLMLASNSHAASVAINPVDADSIKPHLDTNYNSKSYIYSYYEGVPIEKHTAFMRFDLTSIADGASITGMTLKMSTQLNTVTPGTTARIYRGDNDNWSSTTQDVYPGTNELLGGAQVIGGSFTYYSWTLDEEAVDWTEDLNDNTLTLEINSPGYLNWFALDGLNFARYPLLTIDYEEGVLIPGDANHDGIVDGADYTLWADNYLQTGQTWEEGDFTDDGLVDGADYTIWADNYDPAPALASAIPEPSTWALAMIGLVGLVGYGGLRLKHKQRSRLIR